jgi:cytoskeleton protein RodZ
MPQVGRGRFRRSVIPGVLAALALFGIVVAGWYYDTLRKKPAEELAMPAPDARQGVAEGEPASVQPPPAEPAQNAAEAPAAPAPAPAAPAVAGVPVPLSPTVTESAPAKPALLAAEAGRDRLVFQFAQDAWVEVKDKSGKVVFSRLGKAGSEETFDISAPVSLVIGNARNVKLQRNGTAVDIPTPGKVTVGRLKLD